MDGKAVIEWIGVYPVKALRGIALREAVVTRLGLAGDRRWMCVKEADGRFISQRDVPSLATLDAVTDGKGISLRDDNGNVLRVEIGPGASTRAVTVWEDEVPAEDAGDEAADWLTRRLDLRERVRLVHFPESHLRACDPKYTSGTSARTAFADGFPILLISAETHEELNAKLVARGKAEVPMDRFRPNLVLRGLGSGGEDRAKELVLGDSVRIRIVKPCSRCVVITRDQRTGVSSDPKEPTATLATYRRGPDGKKVLFGQNAIVVDGVGSTIRVGDPVRVESGT